MGLITRILDGFSAGLLGLMIGMTDMICFIGLVLIPALSAISIVIRNLITGKPLLNLDVCIMGGFAIFGIIILSYTILNVPKTKISKKKKVLIR